MSEDFRSVRDLEVEGRRVFVRVDFNVPLEGSAVTDDTRIRAALPTLKYLLEKNARIVLASHLGRPKGQPNPKYSLEPAGARLAELLEVEVILTDDCIGDGARKVVTDLREGQIALLENLRFHAEEEANDENFARELAKHADVYINDAFGAAHRAHASVAALPALFRERGAGLLMEAELSSLSRVTQTPEKPFVAILGGAKVSDKIAVIEALMSKVDTLIIGGAMANTFLGAEGKSMGKSLVEADKYALARSLVIKARERNVKLLLPTDFVVADAFESETGRVVNTDQVGDDQPALDIGPASVALFGEAIASAKTIFWNGPMGLFERPAFAGGTLGVANKIAARKDKAFTVVGGGDSVAAVTQAGMEGEFSHISTGGGASLELIEGRKLPGVEALKK